MNKASDLIAHLESGGLLVRGDPDHMEFIRLEDGRVRSYGWSSALGTGNDRLIDLVKNPDSWLCTEDGEDAIEIERKALIVINQAGHFEGYQWQWTDGRRERSY